MKRYRVYTWNQNCPSGLLNNDGGELTPVNFQGDFDTEQLAVTHCENSPSIMQHDCVEIFDSFGGPNKILKN